MLRGPVERIYLEIRDAEDGLRKKTDW